MNYNKETISTIKDDIAPLVTAVYDEVEVDTDKLAFSLDWDSYNKLEQLDMLHIFTARKQEKLVGFLVMIATKSLHASNNIVAASDVIYIQPSERKGNVAKKFIQYAEKSLADLGVSAMFITTKTKAPFDKLLESVGFSNTEKVFQKYIGDK